LFFVSLIRIAALHDGVDNAKDTMTFALARSASSIASRRLSGRQMSTAKLHKAKDHWQGLKSKRPIDHDDLHVRCFRVEFLNQEFQIPTHGSASGLWNSRKSSTPRLTRLALLPVLLR
jgi:hypothetical protein